MCTLTWWRESEETYEIFFNRDEKKTRARAVEPRPFDVGGVPFLMPRDPEAGGTWMLANTRGVVVCLLNRWHEELMIDELVESRGLLVKRMAGMENVPAVEERLRGQDLGRTRPFTLVAFDPVGERGFDWDGRDLRRVELRMPMCSSSYHFEEVRAARRTRFAELVGASRCRGSDLERYHADTAAGASARTVRMCRPDAQTMSRSRVRVGPQRVRWDYWEEQPDLTGLPVARRVELVRQEDRREEVGTPRVSEAPA